MVLKLGLCDYKMSRNTGFVNHCREVFGRGGWVTIILGESIVGVAHPKCSSNTAYTKKDKQIYLLKLFINSVPASTRLMCQVAPKEGNEVIPSVV